MPYSAGSVLLEVVPSFHGLQRAAERAAKQAGPAFAKGIDDGLREADKNAEQAGTRAADKYGGAFGKTLKARLAKSIDDLGKAEVNVTVKDDAARASLASLRKDLQTFNELNIGVDIDSRDAIAQARALEARLKAIADDGTLDFQVRVDANQARSQLQEFSKYVSSALGPSKSEYAEAYQTNRDYNTKVRQETSETARVEREAAKAAADARRAMLTEAYRMNADYNRQAQASARETARAEAAASKEAADARRAMLNEAYAINRQVDQGAREAARSDAADRKAMLAEAYRANREFDQRLAASRKATRDQERQDNRSMLAEAYQLNRIYDEANKRHDSSNNSTATGQTANAFRVFNGALLTALTLGPLLVPVLAALTAGMLGLGVAIGGALLGVGALFAGLAGIGGAVTALSNFDKAQRKNSTAKPPSAANLRGLRDAQTALARAQQDAGQQIATAVDSQARAERGLQQAQVDATKAQAALTQARIDAAQKIQDLRDQLEGGLLDEKQATFAVQEALVHLNVVLEDKQSTSREKDVAKLAYDQAVHNLNELQKQNQRTAAEVAKANAAGVEGSDQVVQAKQDIVDANQNVIDAEKAVLDADKQVTRARIDEARTLADAQQGVVDAQNTVTDAVVGTGSSGAIAMNALNEAMIGLTPTGQAFARFLYGLKPLLDAIRGAAQDGLLPGLQDMISTLVSKYGPAFTTFIGGLATLLGQLFSQAGKVFTAPFWTSFFEMFAKFAPTFVTDFFQIGLDLLTIIAGLAKAFLPFAGKFTDALVKILDGVASWASQLDTSKGFQKFLVYIQKEGPKIATAVFLIATALLNLAIGIAPYADRLLSLLIGFAGWLASLSPHDLALIAGAILGIVLAIQAIAALASIVGSIAGLVAFVGAFAEAIGAILGVAAIAAVVAIVVGAIVLLILWIRNLYQTNEDFRNKVGAIWTAIGDIISGAADVINTVLTPVNAFIADILGPTILWFWEQIVKPTFGFIMDVFRIFGDVATTMANIVSQVFTYILFPLLKQFYDDHIAPIWEGYIKPLFEAMGSWISDKLAPAWQAGLNAIGAIWASLIDLVKKPIEFVVNTVINGGIIDTFNKLVSMFPGMTKVDHIMLPSGWDQGGTKGGSGGRALAMATGGVLPGYTPGRDVHQFVSASGLRLDLSGGEGILVPELARELGSDRIRRANRAARSGGGGARYLGGFADGGILGWLGKAGKGATDAITGVASNVTNLLKDPTGILTGLVKSLVGSTSGIAGAAGSMALRGAGDIGGFILSLITGGVGRGATGPSLPPNVLGWQAMEAIVSAAFPGTRFTSAFRPGAITAVGNQSYHALGRAVDMAPSMALFQYLAANFPNSRELFYSPAGTENWINQGRKGYNAPPVTVAEHFSHVHWAMADGGIVPNIYDNGGYLPPGLSVVMNKTNKPEPVLTSQQFDALGAGDGGAHYDIKGPFIGIDALDLAEQIEEIRRRKAGINSLPVLQSGVAQ